MKRLFLIFIFTSLSLFCLSQTIFRSGIFLHHSTGDNIWGPNGSSTSIPLEISAYNVANSLMGEDIVTMNHLWWPDGVNSGNNEWEYWHRIFENKDLSNSDIRPILAANRIVVMKSCFPSSAIDRTGQASDTLNPTLKSIYNYKWHWRHIVKVMQKHPDNFFVIWTNAPLTSGQTDATSGSLAKSFCTWAKDTLAKGLDPVTGNFPKNIYVFDYFAKLTDANGYMLNQYAVDPGDSHPNSTATALIAPQFVNEIFDAAIMYENQILNIEENEHARVILFPNPAKETITIKSSDSENESSISIYDLHGSLLIKQPIHDDQSIIEIRKLPVGIYFIKYENGSTNRTIKFIKE
jgi:hypothetical protein